MQRMTKWSPTATDFTVTVTTNAQAGTKYSNILPVLVKLGNPDRTTFSIRGDTVVVERRRLVTGCQRESE